MDGEPMQNLSLEDKPAEKKRHTGIPEAGFVVDVQEYMSEPDNLVGADRVVERLDQQLSKYRYMECNLAAKRRRLKQQIPDLKRSLEMVCLLKNSNSVLDTHFLLNEQVYVKAKIPPTNIVCLWLGANVMLEYPLEEAEALLNKSIETASLNLQHLQEDLDFLQDQITTTEVNMTRVHNWDVKRKAALEAAAAST